MSLAPPSLLLLGGHLPGTRAVLLLTPSDREPILDRAQAVQRGRQPHVDCGIDEERKQGSCIENQHRDVQSKVLVRQVVQVEHVGENSIRNKRPDDVDQEECVKDEVQGEPVDGPMELGTRSVFLLRLWLRHDWFYWVKLLIVTVLRCWGTELVHSLAGQQ